MSVRLLREDEVELYQDFVCTNRMGTPFHTIEWKGLTSDSFGFAPLYLIDKDEGGDIEGVMPLFRVKDIFGDRIVSLPLRDKGGGIFNTAQSAERMIDYIVSYTIDKEMDYLQIKTDNPDEARLLERKLFVRKDEWLINYIKLSNSFDEVSSNFKDSRLGWSMNKARRSGLEFREGVGLEDVCRFYSIFLNNRKRLGVLPYSLDFFENIYQRFVKKGFAKIFFVSKDNLTLTAIFIFLMRSKAYDVYSASIEKAYDYRANDFQMYNVLKWLCHNGYEEYDLGADSPYQESLLNYKRKWGAMSKKLYFYYHFNARKNISIRDSDHPKYRILRSILRNMPRFIFEKIGPQIIKQLA